MSVSPGESPPGVRPRRAARSSFRLARPDHAYGATTRQRNVQVRGIANVRAGVPEKSHASVTLAFMSMIAERAAAGGHAGADDFIDRNPDLLEPDVLARWYSQKALGSEIARKVAVMSERVAEAASPD